MSGKRMKRISEMAPEQAPWYRRVAHGLLLGALLIGCLLLTPATASAAKKKKEEEAPTKSYVLPYMVVMMMVSVGLMTVCRPGKRKDRPDEVKPEEE
jgi:acyl dehydratase